MLMLLGDGYEFLVCGGVYICYGVGLCMCCVVVDCGRWVEWMMCYVLDVSGCDVVIQLWKDGVYVFDGLGKLNVYFDDDKVYFKFGVYKFEWQKLLLDIECIVFYFSDVCVEERLF